MAFDCEVRRCMSFIPRNDSTLKIILVFSCVGIIVNLFLLEARTKLNIDVSRSIPSTTISQVNPRESTKNANPIMYQSGNFSVKSIIQKSLQVKGSSTEFKPQNSSQVKGSSTVFKRKRLQVNGSLSKITRRKNMQGQVKKKSNYRRKNMQGQVKKKSNYRRKSMQGQVKKKSNYISISPTYRSTEILRDKFNVSLACPLLPPHLKGRRNITLESIPSLKELEKNYSGLLPGGRYHPVECEARQRVAIVIPFRDREQHLTALLYYLHPFLQRQQLEYGIYVIEQEDKEAFNRGALMNVGFLEALKLHPYDCFIFHDVDLIPEDDRNLYICLNQPKHMLLGRNVAGYKLPYVDFFGGVIAMSTDQVRKVNGFSNVFWGWGGEDDDMSWRVLSHGFKILRYPGPIGRYTMMYHRPQKVNPDRMHLLEKKRNLSSNGLKTIKYKVLDLKLTNLYTFIKIKLMIKDKSPS